MKASSLSQLKFLDIASKETLRLIILYRLVDKYMGQPRLMKLNITNIDENYLSSDIVSVTLAWLGLAYF
jgi:hypothetical protein